MEKEGKYEKFIGYICSICQKDKGTAAALRRADLMQSNATVLSTLVKFGIDITKESEYIPYSLVTAAIARSKVYENGDVLLGAALYAAEKTPSAGSNKDDARVRRLLSCNSLQELSLIFRHYIQFILSRYSCKFNYAELLKDLCSFKYEEGRERVKKKWALQFYSHVSGDQNDL